MRCTAAKFCNDKINEVLTFLIFVVPAVTPSDLSEVLQGALKDKVSEHERPPASI